MSKTRDIEMKNKPIQKSLEALQKEMLLSILSVKGVIYTYYENKLSHREADNSLETFLGIVEILLVLTLKLNYQKKQI